MVCLRSTKTRSAGLQKCFTDLSARVGGGGCEMATTNRLPRKNGPRLVQGVSPATSDALTAVGWVDAVAQTGWSCLGGGCEHQLLREGTKTAEFKEPGPPVID